MQDLPVIFKWHYFQSLKKANFLWNYNFVRQCFLSEQAQKICSWPLITSVQCSSFVKTIVPFSPHFVQELIL